MYVDSTAAAPEVCLDRTHIRPATLIDSSFARMYGLLQAWAMSCLCHAHINLKGNLGVAACDCHLGRGHGQQCTFDRLSTWGAYDRQLSWQGDIASWVVLCCKQPSQ